MKDNNEEKEKKRRQVPCAGGCGTELELGHIGIKCQQDHHLCSDCSKSFANVVFGEPHHYLPIKCQICHCPIASGTFERQLDDTQLNLYLSLQMVYDPSKMINKGEEALFCPFCQYVEIRDEKSTNFLWCKSSSCNVMSCSICKSKLTGEYEEIEEESKEEQDIDKHFKCFELKEDKYQFEEGIRLGQGTACPSCGCVGSKDENCTHIVCMACNITYCYVCGLKEAKKRKKEMILYICIILIGMKITKDAQ